MFAKLSMELETETHDFLSYQKAVILQSILMEQVESDYAEKLHQSILHPYSQSIVNKNGKNIWTIYTTNKEAFSLIIKPLEDPRFNYFRMEKDKREVMIKKKELLQIEKDQFMEKYYFANQSHYFYILFRTPTAFKRQGNYIYYPDLQLIYQSLMNRYDASDLEERLSDEEVLEQLVAYSKIIQYRLQSTFYMIGKVKIPAFIGEILIKCNGSQTMANFSNLLFRFGEFSGVGVKTAMGMGNISIVEKMV